MRFFLIANRTYIYGVIFVNNYSESIGGTKSHVKNDAKICSLWLFITEIILTFFYFLV
ncbi:hypothetical protein AsAng_0027090 [Aureispira anguillae]|uniref:Uncharacterized protein n=1 Tax=Aureispira anguillae TaxID=2864201 RepID=A0A916DRQ1_9BACT|nr:hypothetical protein AsAng_0027090 [Aureispira anguillae]